MLLQQGEEMGQTGWAPLQLPHAPPPTPLLTVPRCPRASRRGWGPDDPSLLDHQRGGDPGSSTVASGTPSRTSPEVLQGHPTPHPASSARVHNLILNVDVDQSKALIDSQFTTAVLRNTI